jgi:hypothetical protein
MFQNSSPPYRGAPRTSPQLHPSSFEMRCTVPVPLPSNFATFKIPIPFVSCLRTLRSVALSIFGRPSFTPWATARLRPALMRWRIIVRSNSAKAPVTTKPRRCGLHRDACTQHEHDGADSKTCLHHFLRHFFPQNRIICIGAPLQTPQRIGQRPPQDQPWAALHRQILL